MGGRGAVILKKKWPRHLLGGSVCVAYGCRGAHNGAGGMEAGTQGRKRRDHIFNYKYKTDKELVVGDRF